MPCYKGPDSRSFWDRAQDLAVRVGVMQEADRLDQCPAEEPGETGQKSNDEVLGKSIRDILKSRETGEDYILVAHLGSLLMEKENTRGLDSFSRAEKSVYLAGDMIRQLDSGGFATYFYNTGHLASELPGALEAIGAEECRLLVEQAISIFGETPSTDYDKMIEQLDKVTDNFETNPWEALDDKYYDLEENLGEKIMNYVDNKQEQFSL